MTGLSAQQKSLLVAAIGLIASIGTYVASVVAANPTAFPPWVSTIPGGIGVLVGFLNNFEDANPTVQQADIDGVKIVVAKFKAMPPEQQQAAYSYLVTTIEALLGI